MELNEITSAIYANVIAKLKGTEIVKELVEMKISDYGIYCVTWNLQQIPFPRHADPMDYAVCRIGIYH